MATQQNIPIPQNPIGENFAWRDWFQKLSNKVYGSMANQDSGSVVITGGTINGTSIGAATPSTGKFTTLDATTTRTTNLLVDSGTNGQILVGRTSDHAFLPATLGAGTGIAITSGAGTLSVANSGVTSIVAGTGISVSGATGAVTVSTTGTGTSAPHIEAYDRSTSITVNNTPTLLIPASTIAGSVSITYDNTTGVFTFPSAGSYGLSLSVNALATTANQFLYIYAENNTGSGWVVNTNSGKYYNLTNGTTIQIYYSQSVYRSAGQQVRYWIYSNGTSTTLQTQTLPGVSGVYVPAIRIQYIG
jgi:hypothetical protein